MRLPEFLLNPRILTHHFVLLLWIAGAAGIFAEITSPSIDSILMQQKARIIKIPSLPAFSAADANELRAYEIVLKPSLWPFAWVEMTVDNCLVNFSVNRQALPLPDLGICHLSYPSLINLSPYLQTGTNTLDFIVRNLDGPMGFDARFESYPWHMDRMLKSLAIVALCALVMLKYGRAERWGAPVFWLVLCSLLLSCMQYFSSPYNLYDNDIGGHEGYLRYLLEYGQVPPPLGWQTQQPPLYYIAAVIFYKAGEWLGTSNPIYAARLLSMLLYLAFLWLSMETVHLYLKGRYAVLASAVVLFWPDGFTYAGRINTDTPMLALNALTLYMASRWHLESNPRWLRYGWYSALFGLTIKGSAVMGIGFVGLMTLLALWRKQVTRRFFMDFTGWGIAACSVVIYGCRIFYYRVFEHLNVQWFENVDVAHSGMPIVGTAPYNFLYFDVARFIQLPFSFSYPNEPLFWNNFFKTLLFGEWGWPSPLIALLLSALFIFMLGLIVAYLLRWGLLYRGTGFQALCPPLVLMMLCMAGASIANSIDVPWGCSENARYVCGIIVPMAIYMAKSAEWHWQQQRLLLAAANIGAIAAFCALSALLITVLIIAEYSV